MQKDISETPNPPQPSIKHGPPKKNTPFTSKRLVIQRVLEVIKKNQPIKPDVLKAKLTVNEPFLSDSRAQEYIVNLALAGDIEYKEQENGENFICLSK